MLFVKNVFLNENIKSILVAPFCGTHFELTLFFFNSSSNTTLLFWLYNQIIPFWIGFLLLINQKNNKSIGLIYASLFLYSPFPCVTLAPVVIYMIFKNYSNENVKTIEKVKSALSIQNIASVPLFVIIATFIVSNNSARKIELLKLDKSNMFLLLAFLVTEVIVYLIFVYNKKDIILNILIITTIITSFVVMGDSYDFAWRTAIPLSFYLMLLTIKYLNNTHVNKMKKRLLIVLICIGALTPLSEISRTLRCEYNVIKGKDTAMSDSLDSIFEKDNNDCRNNFISDDSNSIFFNYIAKQNTEDEYERFTNNR